MTQALALAKKPHIVIGKQMVPRDNVLSGITFISSIRRQINVGHAT